MTEWEVEVQGQVYTALRSIYNGGSAKVTIQHPIQGQSTLARVGLTVTPVREVGYLSDEIDIDVVPDSRYVGSSLAWQLTIRILISVSPPEQGWDRFKDTYSNIGEPGALSERVAILARLVDANELAVSEPGTTSHLAHRAHLAGRTINGDAVRALCGVYFVPGQDHDSMPPCDTCQERLAELPE